jgi:hypothetical protein
MFGYSTVTAGRARYVTLLSEGYYQYDAYVEWNTDWTGTAFPYIEPSCDIDGTPDNIINSAVTYWSLFGGWIGAEQLNTDEYTHGQIAMTVYFNYLKADFGNTADLGIGVNLRSSSSATKFFGAGLVVTRLGDAMTDLTIA